MTITDEAFQQRSMAAVQTAMLEIARQRSEEAFDLGVLEAVQDLDNFGLSFEDLRDEDALRFVQRFEFDAIQRITTEQQTALRQILQESARTGRSVTRTMDRVRESLRVQEWRVEAIARTESNRMANNGRLASWRQSNVVREKEVVATLDARVRDDHLAAHGDRVPVDQPFSRGAAAGKQAPPWGPMCRCTLIAITTRGSTASSDIREQRRQEAQAIADERGLGIQLQDVPDRKPSAVRLEIGGLRDHEDEHSSDLVAAWRSWADLYEQEARTSPDLVIA